MRYDRMVLGYHGCDERVARRLLRGERWRPSQNAWDWLGHGIYFWEFGHARALRWAEAEAARPGARIARPAILGAVLQLGNCLDLLDVKHTRAVGELFAAFEASAASSRTPLPVNGGSTPERKLRKLDCAVLNFFLDVGQRQGPPYDSVRCAFSEGEPVFPGSCLTTEAHIQIAIRNPDCILGVFRPSV